MSRRQTLGQLSPNSMAIRIDQSKDKAAQKKRLTIMAPAGRMSMAPRPGVPSELPRRSSVYGKNAAAGGVKQDPRSLNDKQFIGNCIRVLIGYLTTHGYDHAVTPKMLQNPTGKEFQHLANFLFRKIDPSYEQKDKIEDEVPTMFKRLHYPFTISKSALYAVGSPTTWPALLAALVWLVELLMYDERAQEETNRNVDFSRPSEDAGIESEMFFQYVTRSYHHFLALEDDVNAALDAELAGRFQAREAAAVQDMERLEAEHARLASEIQSLRSAPSALIELGRKRGDLAADVDKFHKLIASLQRHKKDLVKRVEERQADVEGREAELRAVEGENEGLRGRVAAQVYSRDDVERMTRDRRRQEDALAAAASLRERTEAACAEAEAELARCTASLDNAAKSYNAHAERLQLVPADAKRAKGVDYEFRFNRAAPSAAEIRGTDVKGAVVPGLQKIKEYYLLRTRECGEERLALQERLDRADEKVGDLRDEGTALDEEVRRLEAQFRAAREALEAEVRATSAQAEKVKAEVDQLRSIGSQSAADSDERVQGLALELQELQRRCAREHESMSRAMEAAVDALISHKAHIEQTLGRVHAHVAQAHRDVEVLAA